MANYDQHIDWAKGELKDNEQQYHKRKSTVITVLADKLEKEGMQAEKISSYMSEALTGFVSERYVRDVLKDEKYKVKSMQRKIAAQVPQILSGGETVPQEPEGFMGKDEEPPAGKQWYGEEDMTLEPPKNQDIEKINEKMKEMQERMDKMQKDFT